MRQAVWNGTICVLASLFVACVAPPTDKVIDRIVLGAAVQTPSGNFSDVAWLSENHLVVVYAPDVMQTTVKGLRLWDLELESHDLRQIELPEPSGTSCFLVDFNDPVKLTDNQLALTRSCSTKSGWETQLLVWDSAALTATVKYSYDLPSDASVFAFTPDHSQSAFSTHSGIADKVYWAEDGGYEDIDVNMDRAHYPSLSPDGVTLVFFGARDLPGAPGPDWALKSDDLWSIPANCRQPTSACRQSASLIATDILDPLRVKWAPQGTWLVFDGDFQGHGGGIWLLNTQSHSIYRIADDNYEKPDWSPDGQKIVTLAPTVISTANPGMPINPGLYIFDVHNILGN